MTEFDYTEAKQHLIGLGACDRCLGRQFHGLFSGRDNGEIGSIVRASDSLEQATNASPGEVLLKEDCPLCQGYFLHTHELAQQALDLISNLDFNSFVVGCRIDNSLLAKEEEVWTHVGAMHCEPLKKDLVRQIGIEISESTGKDADFTRPDLTILANFKTRSVSIESHALFVYGEYRKLVRGIPQTKWYCRTCRGRGCKNCNYTGKMYEESVEEIIAKPLLEETGAKNEKFHGAGREDIDATMFGWRPFVLELQKPLLRFLDWDAVEAEVNKQANGKVEVRGLRISSKDEVRLLKAVKHDKTYEAIIECENEVTDESIKKIITEFQGKQTSQRTPERVSHRRADLVRKRIIHSVELDKINPNKLRAVIKAEAGAYIKELISGDDGRTTPSFSEFVGPCKCVELNVLEVHKIV